MKITPYILLTFLALALANSLAPNPYCKSRPLYSHLPLTINETLIGDLDYAFTGYNLEFSVTSGKEFAKVKDKLELMSYKNYNFTDIQSLKVTHNGNRWGDSMFVLSDDHGQTIIHYGSFTNHSDSPKLTAAVVEYQENTTCFDAALFMDQGYAIVDCIEQINGTWQNKFIYVNLGKQQREAEVPNEMYGQFNRHTRRKMFRYHDPHNGLQYIIRAYMSHDNNSYIEFFHASDVHDLEILRVFDRSILGVKQLNIADIKIYLGDIFFLDYYTGLYRLDIKRGQMIEVMGHYRAEHYTKFSIYSDDLDEQLLLAISNNHAIYEIRFDTISEPYLLTKYTIPANSWVHQITIDSKYLIVQASANVSSGNDSLITNYTYIFTKGSRTYMNAYKVIEHQSTNVQFDYDRIERRLMFAAETNVTNYKLNDANIWIYTNNASSLGTNQTLGILATSTDPHAVNVSFCNSTTQVYFVNSNDKSIYPTDLPLPSTYYANYPGVVNVNLRNYAIGPNITYNITDNSNQTYPPVFWLNQQNQSKVEFDKNPIKGSNIQFFWAEVFPHRGNNTIFYFYQETNNDFHVSRCEHYYNDILIKCNEVVTQSYRHRIKSFTSVPFLKGAQFNLYYAITLEETNSVYIHSNEHDRIATLEFPTGFEGKIGDVEASNGFLYVCFPYIKTIRVYKISRCEQHQCPLEFELNAFTMSAIGVNYFNPIDVITSRFHPEVIFLNCLGSLIIVDIDNKQNVLLLAEVTSSPAVMVNGYQVAVHEENLVIVAAPNIIEQYSLKDLYAYKTLIYMKNLELYQYKLDSDFDLEFSDNQGLFYLQAVDGNTNLTTILVYKIGSMLVNSLYDVINLLGKYKHNNILIQICGFDVDYVNIVSDIDFLVYRQFAAPILVVEDTFSDFKLDVVYYNVDNNKSLQTLNFSIVNYPREFNTTKEFDQTVKNKLKLESKGEYTWDPRKWFEGHVVGYNASCNDSKVTLIDQIYERGAIDVRGTDFVDSLTGGYAIAEDLVKFRYNGSVHKILLLPDQPQGEICLRLATRVDDIFAVTTCQHYTGGVNVYFTSEADTKGFSWGPFPTQAHYARNVQIMHYILMIADTDEPGVYMQRGGTIFLYALNLDPVTQHQMDLIEEIDSNDFFGAHGWDQEDAYLGNSHLVYDQDDDAYRLYVTEMNNGLFILQFNHTFGHPEVQILVTNFVDLNKILQENDFHMPVDAKFLAVTFSSRISHPHMEVENVIVTTDKYHTFEITLIYDDNAQILGAHLHRVYYRYGWYEAANIVKAEEGYVAIPYILPEIFHDYLRYPRQYIVVYDSQDYEGDSPKGFSERYMLGGFQINNTQTGGFGFNVTYDSLHNGTRTGLVTIDVRNAKMHQNSLSRNITVQVVDGYHSGTMNVTAYNDFHSEKFEITFVASSDDPEKKKLETWEIVLIVVSCVVFSLLMGYLIFLCWKRSQSRPLDQVRVSLLESEVGAAALRHGEQGSMRGSVPETHFRRTVNFETQTGENLEGVPINENDNYEPPAHVQSIVEPPRAVEPSQAQREQAREERREEAPREQAPREIPREEPRSGERSPPNVQEVRAPQNDQIPNPPPAPVEPHNLQNPPRAEGAQ